jgi:hypothetical protein
MCVEPHVSRRADAVFAAAAAPARVTVYHGHHQLLPDAAVGVADGARDRPPRGPLPEPFLPSSLPPTSAFAAADPQLHHDVGAFAVGAAVGTAEGVYVRRRADAVAVVVVGTSSCSAFAAVEPAEEPPHHHQCVGAAVGGGADGAGVGTSDGSSDGSSEGAAVGAGSDGAAVGATGAGVGILGRGNGRAASAGFSSASLLLLPLLLPLLSLPLPLPLSLPLPLPNHGAHHQCDGDGVGASDVGTAVASSFTVGRRVWAVGRAVTGARDGRSVFPGSSSVGRGVSSALCGRCVGGGTGARDGRNVFPGSSSEGAGVGPSLLTSAAAYVAYGPCAQRENNKVDRWTTTRGKKMRRVGNAARELCCSDMGLEGGRVGPLPWRHEP